jgi:GntR family transcriptional regulator, transcriptional repressor for pyruvate dehydrogenase complex
MKENEDYQIKQAPRMFEQVTKQILKFITSDEISNGSKIPTERNLSEMLEVSRSSIREGIRILELLGYLDSRQGEGTFVSNPPSFLIPYRVLNQQLDSLTLQNYYDIFLMSSKQIVLSSLHIDEIRFNASMNITFPDDRINFWADFAAMIQYLGKQLKNPLYLSLWLNTYELLYENKHFQLVHPSLPIQLFSEAFAEGNEAKMMELFDLLAKAA